MHGAMMIDLLAQDIYRRPAVAFPLVPLQGMDVFQNLDTVALTAGFRLSK